MGEIADALRRVRSGGTLPADRAGFAEPGPERGSRRLDGRGEGAHPAAPVSLQVSEPTDRAIVHGHGAELEACRQLALHMRIELESRGARSAAVVSALRDEGKTTTSCNLALALASLSAGRDVALLDLDMRKPSVARVLGIQAREGVEGFLMGTAPLDDVRVAIEGCPLDVYPAITPQKAAHELLTRGLLGDLIGELERRYQTVLVDTPPTLLVPDARLILQRVAVCIPVARAGTTRVRAFREMLDALPRHQVLSCLLNGKRSRGGYYRGYDYAGSEGGGPTSRGGAERPSTHPEPS